MKRLWIKLWIDFLEDDKLGPLQEYLQLRFVKLCLLAGEFDKNGQLPSVERIAWRLRLDMPKVRETLVALREVGVVEETPTCWVIVNFAKRQEALSSTERSRIYRQKQECNENATVSLHSVSASSSVSESDSLTPREESRTHDSAIAEVMRAYEAEIGMLTPLISDSIQDALADYPSEWIIASLQESARQNKRSWKYCEAILKRWKVEGLQSRGSRHNGSKPIESGLPSAFEAWENLCNAWPGQQSVGVEVEGGMAIEKVTYTWLHPEVERIGRMLGWPKTFPGQNLPTDRAHFIKAWESEAKDG